MDYSGQVWLAFSSTECKCRWKKGAPKIDTGKQKEKAKKKKNNHEQNYRFDTKALKSQRSRSTFFLNESMEWSQK